MENQLMTWTGLFGEISDYFPSIFGLNLNETTLD